MKGPKEAMIVPNVQGRELKRQEDSSQVAPEPTITAEQLDQMRVFTRHIWWKSAEEALKWPTRLIIQVMEFGNEADWNRLEAILTNQQMRSALVNAWPGVFSAQRWGYWHRRLGLVDDERDVPPRPRRSFPGAPAAEDFPFP